MGKKSLSGMNIPDHFSESLEKVFEVKNTYILLCGSGSGNFDLGSGIRDGKIRIRDPVETARIRNTGYVIFLISAFNISSDSPLQISSILRCSWL
jgi:hypothetical protein